MEYEIKIDANNGTVDISVKDFPINRIGHLSALKSGSAEEIERIFVLLGASPDKVKEAVAMALDGKLRSPKTFLKHVWSDSYYHM